MDLVHYFLLEFFYKSTTLHSANRLPNFLSLIFPLFMKNNTAGFTLVELLVVITILAIISITAYTSFSGATDKAKNSTKIGHIASIETGLNTFFSEKNYYPMPSQYNANTNVWGYNAAATGTLSNTFSGTKAVGGDQILTVVTGAIVGGGRIYETTLTTQIGAKGTIDSSVLPKQYLSQELSDPAIKDIKVGDTQTFKDYGLGEYIYGVYAKSNTLWDNTGRKGSAYNFAVTLADDQKGAVTKITGNFDKNTCASCPDTLIGSGAKDGASYSGSEVSNSGITIPYAISGF